MDKKEKRKIIYALSLVTQLGITMIVPIFLCLFVGIKVSKYFDKSYFVMIFLVLGMVVSFRNAYQITKKMYIKDKEKEQNKRKIFDDLKKERESKIEKEKRLIREVEGNSKRKKRV